MLDLRVFGESTDTARVAARLDAIRGATQVRVVDTVRPGNSVVRPDVAHDSVDAVLDKLELLVVPAANVSMARVGQVAGRNGETGLVWADVMGVAGTDARLAAAASRSWSWPGSSGATGSLIAIRC